MTTATTIWESFTNAAHEIGIALTKDLPEVPTTACECGSTFFQMIELNYQRSFRMAVRDGELFAYPDGHADYDDSTAVPFVCCSACDKPYNVSQQLIGINWI